MTATTAQRLARPRPIAIATGGLAWRNLWRNRRRTWLTAGGIGFAVWLLVLGLSMQDGSFDVWIDNVARLLTGHVQVQHPRFHDDPALEHRLQNVDARVARLDDYPGVAAVLPRAQSFALVSVGERSFGAQVMGVDPGREQSASSLPTMVDQGRYLGGPGEAFVGSILARNLQLQVGDEVVMLGTALNGGVAAAVATVVGTFSTGQVELDRSLLQIDLGDFREGWNLGDDSAHALLLLLDHTADSERIAAQLAAPDIAVLDWRDLMPEAEQTIEMKRIGTYFFFALITVIVAFSVVNTFMMTVFERTPEFGMLMALGMRAGAISRQLSLEAAWLAALGVALGLAMAVVMVSVLAVTGLPLPEDAAGILAQYNLPSRMYPQFSELAAVFASVTMFLGTQLAVLVPALRVRRLRPVQALRARE